MKTAEKEAGWFDVGREGEDAVGIHKRVQMETTEYRISGPDISGFITSFSASASTLCHTDRK